MKVATGLAIGTAAKPELAAKAVEIAMLKANIHAPSSVLLFLTSEFASDPQSAILAAAKAASCTQVIGCSATGIFTEEDWVIDSPAAAAMVFSDMNFSHPKPDESNDALLMTLAAPNAINTTWLNNSGLNQSNELRFGGVSGDATGHGAFSVWQNGKGTTQGYCEVTLNNASGAVAATHGLKVISAPRRITNCKGNDLLTIANLPAFSSLASACQKNDIATDDLPYHQLMAVYANKASALERGEYNLASIIIANDESQSVTLTKSLRVGDWISWAMRDVDAAQIDIVKTASQLRRQLDSEPEFALLFSCLGRGPYFYNGIDQDLALIKTLFPDLPIIGFYGNGEIAPINGINELLQYSAVLGLFTASNIAYL
jgi:small ligand-binding sensory domain FIST